MTRDVTGSFGSSGQLEQRHAISTISRETPGGFHNISSNPPENGHFHKATRGCIKCGIKCRTSIILIKNEVLNLF